MEDLTSLKVIKNYLCELGIRPSKAWGQNFLLSQKAVVSTVSAADLSKDDVVLEIGPGLGVLTFELAKIARKVIAIEKDPKLAELLQKEIKTEKLKNIEVISEDILKLTTNDLQLTTYKIISNLPYQITSPVLWKFLYGDANRPPQDPPWQGGDVKPELLVLMVQKEVAERIIARPGQMSVLSVLVQYYANVKIVTHVKRAQFYPPPRVDSTVIKLKIQKSKLKAHEGEDLFFKLVKTGFLSKRKMLKNNIASLSKDKNIEKLLEQVNLNPKIRAQELSVSDWIKLYDLVYN